MEIGIVLAVLIGIGVGLLLMTSRKPQKSKRYRNREALDKASVKEKWSKIEETFALNGASNFKAGIMDADKLVEYVLRTKVGGNSMGESLKRGKNLFRNYNDYNNLWFAHKVRNNIAHEVGHDLNSAEAKRAMEYFRKALKELGVL
jgi:hypothetical protein